MKFLLLSFLITLLAFDDSSARLKVLIAPDDVATVITVQGNGYLYPYKEGDTMAIIDETGLRSWKDAQIMAKVFFLTVDNGIIDVALKLRSPDGDSRIRISLDDDKKSYEIATKKTVDYRLSSKISFSLQGAVYHHLNISAISKTGAYFPDMEAVVFSGTAAKSIKYNKSSYRGAASTHLHYPVPGDSAVKWFYSEVTVPRAVEKSVNAYYETNGFNSGYMGIQINSASERRFIFSVWSLFNTDDPKQIPADYGVNLKQKGKDVFTGEFGNEGSGGHSHLVYSWQAGKTYRLLNGIRSMAGDSTTYAGYYALPDDDYKWHLMSEWTQNKTDTKRGLRRLYSFVENFGENGNDYFKAYYGNQWICTPSGNWIELTKATFSTTASDAKHQRYDYGAGLEGNKFYMYTGGFKQLKNISPADTISRPANKKHPVIDFDKLSN